jgi:hypothetical protein
MKKEKLFKVRYRWHTGNTYDTQIVDEATLKKMESSTKFVITSIQEY